VSFEEAQFQQANSVPLSRRGTWVFVVGPSGAGKDTMMRLAKDMAADCPRIIFVRRTVTRPENAFEDHDTATEERFLELQKAGEFVLTWQAHGLHYGIHRCWQDRVNQGCVVVGNISRTMVSYARQNLGNVAIVLVTAPNEILLQRIAARGRDQAAGSRTSRNLNQTMADHVDVIINNVGLRQDGASQLAIFLKKLAG